MIQPGDTIADKYRILRTLGSGGMGVVYLAQHERLQRPVAIKVLHSGLDDARGAVIRFEREIRAMAKVRNPHVAHAFDADVLPDGAPFLVMEYLDGRDLRMERNLRGSIPFPEAVAYLIQACDGVAAVHDVGIVHRDLKPHNLFLTQLTGPRCVKVLDFGIAKSMVGADVTVTSQDLAVGTPLYMSPEQLRTPEDVSSRSDVWALGVVLYELIAGVSPFAADTPGAVVAAVVLDNPVWLADMVPEVPDALAQVISDALIKQPARRIGSVRALAEQLAQFAMPTEAIFVAESAHSEQKVPVLSRAAAHPEVAAHIEREVADFDENASDRERALQLEELRHLPNRAQLAIRPTIPAAPLAHQVQSGAAAANAQRDPSVLKRPSLHPRMAADIERKVTDFDSGVPGRDRAAKLDELRHLPSLAKLVIPTVSPRPAVANEASSPRQGRASIPAGAPSIGLTQISDGVLPGSESPASPTYRGLRWKLGVVVVLSGLFALALTLLLVPSHRSRKTPAPPNRGDRSNPTEATLAERHQSGQSTSSGAPTPVLLAVAQATASQNEDAAPSTVVRDANRSVPVTRRKPVSVGIQSPKPTPIPTAADGKPLHL